METNDFIKILDRLYAGGSVTETEMSLMNDFQRGIVNGIKAFKVECMATVAARSFQFFLNKASKKFVKEEAETYYTFIQRDIDLLEFDIDNLRKAAEWEIVKGE